ncbi:hypothetical protein AAG906_008917 [Vitis piasezkii]
MAPSQSTFDELVIFLGHKRNAQQNRLTHHNLEDLEHSRENLCCSISFSCSENIADKLASFGEPVSNRDQLIYLFQGLGVEYNPFATSFNARSDQPTIEERQNVVELLNVNMAQANLAAFANKKSFKTNQQNFQNFSNQNPFPHGYKNFFTP